MHEPIGTYRADISIFSQGCVTVTLEVGQDGETERHHVHPGPFNDWDALAHALRETFALWVAGADAEEIGARLAAL